MNVSFAKTSCDSLKTQDGGVSLLEIYAREAFVVFLYDFQFRFMFFLLRHRALRIYSLSLVLRDERGASKRANEPTLSRQRSCRCRCKEIRLVSLTPAQRLMVKQQQHHRGLSACKLMIPESKHSAHRHTYARVRAHSGTARRTRRNDPTFST